MEAARSEGILENNGHPEGLLAPPGIEHIVKDPKQPMTVYLFIRREGELDPEDRHWTVLWVLPRSDAKPGQVVVRILEIVREINHPHLTNWGPLARIRRAESMEKALIAIGELSFAERQALEKIAKNTPVYRPNGVYNCQHWVIDVLSQAIHDIPSFGRTSIEEILRVNGRPGLLW
ncbi:hypothetical protein DACRYDRAFT_119219 [Dacryopinax primogenitus]|uniref:Uncharacterized protein n=1 Tax=Dacryopinax primogenitus (strain DJM 731) TaxID=1858805 RepID=M5G182_DACPD|nr:uncharacterized protein DACRYDRAFT_119219 [Dacryopinax primogenitus]EJT97527.1 hypothetical protein DACRYDRAFT_119219 [Dacryopinax primogenitus]